MAQPLPKKLEEALKNQPKYKQVYQAPESVLSSILNDQNPPPTNSAYSFERSLLDKIGGKNNYHLATNEITGNDGSLFPKRPPRNNTQELKSRNMVHDVIGNIDRMSNNNSHQDISVETSISSLGNVTHGENQNQNQNIRDEETITSMANRLNQLERSSRDLRQELVMKEKEMFRLKIRNDILEATIGKSSSTLSTSQSDSSNLISSDKEDKNEIINEYKKKLNIANDTARNAIDETMTLTNENIQLKNKIKEMETFLNDYGLSWRGNETTNETLNEEIDLITNKSNNSGNEEGVKGNDQGVDIDKILLKVEELNSLVSNQGPRLVMEGNR